MILWRVGVSNWLISFPVIYVISLKFGEISNAHTHDSAGIYYKRSMICRMTTNEGQVIHNNEKIIIQACTKNAFRGSNPTVAAVRC